MSASAIEHAYVRVANCSSPPEQIPATVDLILAIFDDFYAQLCEYPYRAQRAFESMNPHDSIRISKERLVFTAGTLRSTDPAFSMSFRPYRAMPICGVRWSRFCLPGSLIGTRLTSPSCLRTPCAAIPIMTSGVPSPTRFLRRARVAQTRWPRSTGICHCADAYGPGPSVCATLARRRKRVGDGTPDVMIGLARAGSART